LNFAGPFTPVLWLYTGNVAVADCYNFRIPTPGVSTASLADAAAVAATSTGRNAAASAAVTPAAPAPFPHHISASEERLADFRASPAAVASVATSPGRFLGSAAASAAAAALLAGSGHTLIPAAPLAIALPFPRHENAVVVPDTGFVASEAGSAMDMPSDANPAAGELPADYALPKATVASTTSSPPTAGAPAAAPPPHTASPSPPGRPAAPPPAKEPVRRMYGRRSGASSASAMPAKDAFGMDVDDPLATATEAAGEGGSPAAPPPAAAVAPFPAPTGSAQGPCAAAAVSVAVGATTTDAAALPPPTARATARGGGAAAAHLSRRTASAGGGPGVAKRRTWTPPAGLVRAFAAVGRSCCAAPFRSRRRLGRMRSPAWPGLRPISQRESCMAEAHLRMTASHEDW